MAQSSDPLLVWAESQVGSLRLRIAATYAAIARAHEILCAACEPAQATVTDDI